MATGTAHVSLRRLPAVTALRLGEAVGVRVALGLLVTISTAVRAIGATAHIGPTLYPDEYIYTALSRSLATSGRPLIRGQVAHFPALLDPLVAAPLWAIAPAQVAYHLVQVENALFMSLAAIPVYLLARALDFRPPYSLVCAAFAVAIPDLAYAGRTLADPIAYPLALAALYAAVVALQKPTARRQIAFLVLAALATFARVEYVVLVPAFVGALLVTRRRQSLTTHRLTLAAVAMGAALALALGPARVLGYYKQVVHLHLGTGLAAWVGNDMFLLAVAGGTVLVPGALVGLAKARGRRDASFSVLAVLYALAIFFAAGLYASNGAARFQERYLLTLLPLIPLAFGLYLRQHRPAPRAVAAISAVLFVASMRLPLSHYAVGLGSTDSPLLWAVTRLDPILGTGSGSLLFAVFIALSAALATAVAFGARARIALGATLAFLVATSVLATSSDLLDTKVRTTPGNPTWIDDARVGDVTAISTPLAPGFVLTDQLYWNQSVRQELLLPGAMSTDIFSVGRARIARDGTVLEGNRPLRSAILFGEYAATASFQNASLVARSARFALWRPHGVARLALLQQGRYVDGWLAPTGGITMWPKPGHRLSGVLTISVSLPDGFGQTTMTFGNERKVVRPGAGTTFNVCVRSDRRWTLPWSSGTALLMGSRAISVVQAPPRFESGAPCGPNSA